VGHFKKKMSVLEAKKLEFLAASLSQFGFRKEKELSTTISNELSLLCLERVSN